METRKTLSSLYLRIGLTGVMLCMAGCAAGPREATEVNDEVGARLDAYLRAEAEAARFSGAVLVAKEGDMVLQQGYGLADRVTGRPNTAETVFPIGSIVKLFTRDALRVLEEQGRLSFDDPLRRFFPEAPPDKANIPLRQIVEHRAGFEPYIGEDFEPLARDAALERVFARPLLFPSGSEYAYSNAGYTVLAAVVEVASGQSFPEFVMEHLVRPAGLKRTGFYGDPRWTDEDVAIGYEGQQHGPVNAPHRWAPPRWALMGGGGMASTVGDLYTWLEWRKARFGRPLLDRVAASLQAYMGPEAEGDRLEQAVAVAAGGGNWGYYAVFAAFADGSTIVVMSNADDDGMEDLTLLGSLANLLYGDPPLKRTAPVLLEADDLQETPAGRRMLAFFDVVTQGDAAAAQQFIADEMDAGFQRMAGELPGYFEEVQRELGPAPVIEAAVQPDPYAVHAYVRHRETGRWTKIHLEVDDRAPYPISGLRTEEAAPPGMGEAAAAASDTCGRERRLPAAPVGQAAAALFDALCQADEEAFRKLVETQYAPALQARFPMAQHLAFLQQLREDVGDADVMGVDLSSPHEGIFTVAMRQGRRLRLSLTVQDAPPHRITALGAEPPAAEPTFTDLDAVRQHLAEQAAAEAFSGVVLAARGGDVVLHEAYGWADRAGGIRNTTTTPFNIGSLNKLFTTVAVLQLVEQGKIDLDTPLGTYLDGFPPDVAERVTVRHLLQHRSGWGAYWENSDYLNNKDQLQTLDDYLAFIREIPLDFEPGTREQYSNTGFEVLGGIIEQVTGQSYYDYVRQHVYAPAGMQHAGSFSHDTSGVAIGYMQQDAGAYAQINRDRLPPRGTPAGGGYATAMDLLRFAHALLGDRLLSRPYTNLMLSRLSTAEDEARQGRTGYAGGIEGANAVWLVDFDTEDVVIVLSNFDPPSAEALAPAILRTIAG